MPRGEAAAVERYHNELLREVFERTSTRRSQTGAEGHGRTAHHGRLTLKPWRQVIEPHPDVRSGRFVQAEFAADLAAVMRGEAAPEYQ